MRQPCVAIGVYHLYGYRLACCGATQNVHKVNKQKEDLMLDTETKELIDNLNMPHRIPNIMVVFQICEKAATVIQKQNATISKLKNQIAEMEAKKPAPRKRATKAAD